MTSPTPATRAEHALADELLAPLTMPIHRVAGNHDLLPERTEFAVEAGGLRIVGCDTSVHGRDDGALDVDALAARLDEDRETPTIVAMHHPPFDIGLPWLDEIGLPRADRDALAALLRALTAGQARRRRARAPRDRGHASAASASVTCASTNIQAALDFDDDARWRWPTSRRRSSCTCCWARRSSPTCSPV